MSGRSQRLERLAGAAGVLVFLLVWELAARLIWRDPQILPSPTQSVAVAAQYLTWGELAGHVGISVMRILVGFTIAAIAGIALGILCGWSRWISALIRPFVEILRPIPPLAWIPIAIIWFGLGEGSKVFVIFLGAFFPIFTSAWRGMTMVSPVLLSAARTMDVDGLRLLVKVAIPATFPDIAIGLQIGFGLSFGILVAAELIAASQGLGYLIMESRQIGQLGIAIFGIFIIGLINLIADYQLAAVIQRTVGRWDPAHQGK